MTKQDLQKELLEKVKPGTKPSHLKKLKRSKSDSDIPKVPPLPNANKEITQLQEQVKFHSKSASNYLKSLQVSQAKASELEEKLKSNPLNSSELDNSLFARHKNLKDWFSQYQKTKHLDQELQENINEASQELINQDQTISQLRNENSKLRQTNQSLQKDLNLTTKLAEMRKVPYYSPENNSTYLKYALYTLLSVAFTLFLVNHLKIKEN